MVAFGTESSLEEGMEGCMKVFEYFPVLWKEVVFFNTLRALRQQNIGIKEGFNMWITVESLVN